MRVGVYVDGYNLYYGGRAQCGRNMAGWRWLDVRALVEDAVTRQGQWPGAHIEHVIYCTARVDAGTNPSAHADQDVYLKALIAAGAVDRIEYGNYVARTKTAFLATEDPKTHKPVITTSSWPVMVKDADHQSVKDAHFMVRYLHLEEKGSDVNLASHLLIDVLSEKVDAAIVVSNDSDLAFPIRTARAHLPVAVINPRGRGTAGGLKGQKADGAGNHWWWQLQPGAYLRHQLPDPAGKYTRPDGW